ATEPTKIMENWPRQQEAEMYLQKHKIRELFNNLSAQLIFEQPNDPKAFMVEHLKTLAGSKAAPEKAPCLFDDSNLTAIFHMLDAAGRGYVTKNQYAEAMETLGLSHFDRYPPGGDNDMITLDTFVREGRKGLTKQSATYSG
ncbi:hypothetical protein BOX15_Mlig006014g1, partial [Macrostomum lignano]